MNSSKPLRISRSWRGTVSQAQPPDKLYNYGRIHVFNMKVGGCCVIVKLRLSLQSYHHKQSTMNSDFEHNDALWERRKGAIEASYAICKQDPRCEKPKPAGSYPTYGDFLGCCPESAPFAWHSKSTSSLVANPDEQLITHRCGLGLWLSIDTEDE